MLTSIIELVHGQHQWRILPLTTIGNNASPTTYSEEGKIQEDNQAQESLNRYLHPRMPALRLETLKEKNPDLYNKLSVC